MKSLSKAYAGGKKIVEDVWLSFLPNAKIGVIGQNGTGKSTLMKIMAGVDTEYNGEAWAAKDARVGYLPQEPQLDPSKDVAGNVMEALAATKALVDEFNDISMKLGEIEDMDEMNLLIEKQGELQEQIEAADAWDLERKVDIAMDALRCPPGDSDVSSLSGGERRRVALCRLLLEKPDLLLLDEPTNHLDAESVAWLQRYLAEYSGCVVMVTHDRYFLDNVAGWILELDRGRALPFEGNYSNWLEAKDKRMRQESKEEAARQRTLAREREWISASPKARQAKSKARINSYNDLMDRAAERAPSKAQIVIPMPERLGDNVIDAAALTKSFGNRLLINKLDFKLPRGGIVGVIGANGAGKTTLFRMITGQETPDSGDLKVGESVQFGYVDQSRDVLPSDQTVWEVISDGLDVIDLGKYTMQSRAYVGAFNFRGPDQQKKVGQLSGGERNRVHLARILKSKSNVLMLDEPTNDLDVETLSALEDALEDFPGCAIVISHDRWFLNKLATHILAFEGDGEVVWFEGNYEDYEADRRRRLGSEADTPQRFRYKPLERGA